MALMIFAAIVTGVNVVLCRFLNSASAEKNGLPMSTLMNYITGLLTSVLVLWIAKEAGGFSLKWQGVPTFALYTGGAVGVFSVFLSSYLTPRLPAFLQTLLIFIAQLLTAALLDYWLEGSLSIGKLVGGALVFLGLWHYQWVHKSHAAPVTSCEPDSQES